MSKILIVIFALFAITMASSFRTQVADDELRVGKDGQVTLKYVTGAGYTVPVDNSKLTIFSKNMVLSLYSSNTLFTKSCFNYDSYDCKSSNCRRDAQNFRVNYPYFTAEGHYASASAHLDYNNWNLNKNVRTLVATRCVAPAVERIGAGTQGILGLGVEGMARSNFQYAGSFSIFNNKHFRLVFNPSALPSPQFRLNPIAKVRTDGNWRVPNVQAFAIRDPKNPNAPLRNPLQGTSAIWDINSDAIGLPLPLYQTFVQALTQYGVLCPPNVWNKPICTYNGMTQNLPNVEVQAEQNIIITPQMYALSGNGRSFELNFKAMAPTLTGVNYVTPDYQFTIILGNTVLGGYFTHFNIQEQAVQLYQVL